MTTKDKSRLPINPAAWAEMPAQQRRDWVRRHTQEHCLSAHTVYMRLRSLGCQSSRGQKKSRITSA